MVSRFSFLALLCVTLNLVPSPLCSAEITFKTDPKNTDYASEHGASRNFEPWRDEKAVEEEDRLARLEEEENNPMKALENRTLDSKREMEILDALGDIRARNARNERVAMGVMTGEKDVLDRIARDEVEEEAMRAKRLEDEEDERLVREVFSRVVAGSGPIAGPSGLNGGDGEEEEEEEPKQVAMMIVKRKAEGDEPDVLDLLSENAKALLQPSASSPSTQAKKSSTAGPSSSGSGAPKASTIPSLAGVVVKKRKADASSALGIKVKKKKAVAV